MKEDILQVPLKYLFEPDSIAVIGASRKPGKVGHSILNNLKTNDYSGAIYPVNPKAEEIMGFTCYPKVSEVPEEVDIALIAVPAKIVPGVVKNPAHRAGHIKRQW